MINTFLKIGRKLRENSDNVRFLPFVEIGEVEDKKDKNGKVTQEKPFVQIYDVFIDGENWKMEKSDAPYNENHPPVFIKGDNQDRFYVAGDMSGNYFGKDANLEKYFYAKDKEIINYFNDGFIAKFRKILEEKVEEIEKFIKDFNSINLQQKIIIQFRFIQESKFSYWKDKYQEIVSIGNFILSTSYITKDRLIKKAPVSFYTSYNLNSLQLLNAENSYKSFKTDFYLDSIEALKDLIIADKYISNSRKYFGKAYVQILPVGDYSTSSLLTFLQEDNLYNAKSININQENLATNDDPFEIFYREESISKFDILFLNRGANTTDTTMYQSSINLSYIDQILQKFNLAKEHTQLYLTKNILNNLGSEKIKNIILEELKKLTPFTATSKLIKGQGKNDGNLEKHHKEMLYKIFRNTYFQDPILLTKFNEKIEFGLRNKESFSLDYLLFFVNYIYINHILIHNDYIIMKETQSYKAGKLLGGLAKNLDSKINSFSKQYAGNISRRVSTKDDLVKLLNFINEKLVIHEKLYPNVREASTELISMVNSFAEPYKKDYVIAGFFESYLMPYPKKEESETK